MIVFIFLSALFAYPLQALADSFHSAYVTVLWAKGVIASARTGTLRIVDGITAIQITCTLTITIVAFVMLMFVRDNTWPNLIVIVLGVFVIAYMLAGTQGLVELLTERRRWIAVDRLIGQVFDDV
jgi:cell division protein FtsW (lipid II flippase)